MLCAQRGSKAKSLALWADPNAQLTGQQPLTELIQPLNKPIQPFDNLTVGLADLGSTGPAGIVRYFPRVDIC